ncbi:MULTISPECIES: LysR family transcriptional regulator [Burkholderiales]|uniref:LysR family transcriptional regulator n=1 Tax=Burkholderiales TaxID=80840 RepID=UPI0025A583D8|nr:LysR family transcriptional regulator [Pandoraea communis]MDM8359277.1 LysR family transcriptional regulator [Pandoraea communis]
MKTIERIHMEIYQLRTFIAVAREGSITRASDLLFLSQPAISAHIKSLEEELELTLFERTPRGMSLTTDGSQLLVKADQMMNVHREMMEEARRIKGRLCGEVRLGSVRNSSTHVLSRILGELSSSFPDVEVKLLYGTSAEIAKGIRNGNLDAGLFFDADTEDDTIAHVELQRVGIFLTAPPGLVRNTWQPNWAELSELPWVCPVSNTCCGTVAEQIFQLHSFRPKRILSVDLESVTRTLIAGGVGVGLLHEETAFEARQKGEVELIGESPQQKIRLVFSSLTGKAHDPIISAITNIVHSLVIDECPCE